MERTTITIDKSYMPLYERMSNDYGISKKKLFEFMLNYFEVTGINPTETTRPSFSKEFKELKDEVKKMRETTVSFIKQQEKGMLKPLVEQVNTSTQQLLIYLANEPLTVKHLEEFKKVFSPISNNTELKEERKQLPSTDNNNFNQDYIDNIIQKAEMNLSNAKVLFKRFIETGKKSFRGSYSFEENTINMYKSEFDRLKLKL